MREKNNYMMKFVRQILVQESKNKQLDWPPRSSYTRETLKYAVCTRSIMPTQQCAAGRDQLK